MAPSRLAPAAGESDRSVPGRAGALLVSFCNVGYGAGPFLALVGVEDGRVEWVAPGEEAERSHRGVTGLCWHRAPGEAPLVAAAYQGAGGRGARRGEPTGQAGTEAALRLLDPDLGFAPVSGAAIPRGVHSVCSDGCDLYVVVSREDTIYRASPRGAVPRVGGGWDVQRHWVLPGSTGSDENHLNAVGFAGENGELCVSGFGRRPGDDWNAATGGFVLGTVTGEKIIAPVHHPHSMLRDSGRIWTCESKTNRLVSDDGRAIPVGPSTYLRGLAAADGAFYAASSKRRVVSESTGEPVKGARAERWGRCELYRVDKETGSVEMLADFSGTRNEIYDVLPLPA